MRFDVLTLFPEEVLAFLSSSIIGRAQKDDKVIIEAHNIRDYTLDKHRRVDDYPYGGGAGMVMQAEPIVRCFEALCEKLSKRPHVVFMSAHGQVLNQQKVKELKNYENIAVLCGHYEGVDQRAIDLIVDEEISVGDYVVTGGELPAMILIDAVSRMLPGVLSNEDGFTDESHFDGLLEYPQYTRPEEYRDLKVPEVLLSGHHANITKWKEEQKIIVTKQKRPDLLKT